MVESPLFRLAVEHLAGRSGGSGALRLESNNTDAPKILAAIARAAGRPAPSIETIQKELRADRARRREMQQMQNPIVKLAPDSELGKLMLRMLHREDSSKAVTQRIVDAMVEWAGTDRRKKAALAGYCKAVLEKFDYNEDVQRALRKLAGKTSKRYL